MPRGKQPDGRYPPAVCREWTDTQPVFFCRIFADGRGGCGVLSNPRPKICARNVQHFPARRRLNRADSAARQRRAAENRGNRTVRRRHEIRQIASVCVAEFF